MRILISGGGTGGHVYPALAVADALKAIAAIAQDRPAAEVLYVGSLGGMEKGIVARAGLPYQEIDAGQVRGITPLALLQNIRHLWRGYQQAHALLSVWPADVVFITGGYVTVPLSLAAWRRAIPVMIYLPDLQPGWAVRFLSHLATRIAVSFDEVRPSFPGTRRQKKVWVSGYPVRAAFFEAEADRLAGYQSLGLDSALKTVLVFGGSRGARSINQAIAAIAAELIAHCQIVHVSGELDWPQVRQEHDRLPAKVRSRYHVYPYLHEEMIAAMAVADLAIARAGAATTAEFPAMGLPSILVPYPYAGQHQGRNADFMAAHGAAVRIDDADLHAQLKPTVTRLLQDEAMLKEMRARALALSRPSAAHHLAAELQRLAHSRRGKAP